MDIQEIRETLRDNIVLVEFTKKNGEFRRMVCTTKEDVIPKVYGASVPNDEIVTVWDVEKDAWRAFRVDSIINFEVQ